MRVSLGKLLIFAVAGALLLAAPARAHHSFASEFSLEKPITMTGTVTKLDWINPHCYLELDAKDAQGSVTEHWRFEFGAPVALKKAGLRQEALAPGQTVTINGYAAKDRSKLGWVSKFTLSDGRVILITPDTNSGAPNPAQ
jgi:hypothetical protein